MDSAIQTLSGQGFADYLKNAQELIVANFFHEKQTALPIVSLLENLAQEKIHNVKFIHVDYNLPHEFHEFSEELRVESTPTLIMFKNGVEVSRHVGLLPYTELKNLIVYLKSFIELEYKVKKI